jgi:hypothetical protein
MSLTSMKLECTRLSDVYESVLWCHTNVSHSSIGCIVAPRQRCFQVNLLMLSWCRNDSTIHRLDAGFDVTFASNLAVDKADGTVAPGCNGSIKTARDALLEWRILPSCKD